jgi:hypothetical protein
MTHDALLAACKAEFPALDWAPVHGDVDDDRRLVFSGGKDRA